MVLRFRIFFVALTMILSSLSAFAQKLKKADKTTLTNLETHIRYLSDAKLEGRRTGTTGEKAASDYISSAFSQAGLVPKGDHNGWLQSFDIDEGRQIDATTAVSINDKPLLLNKEYFPLTFSASGSVSGSPAIALQERGVPWFLDIKELMEGGAHPNLENIIRERASSSAQKGATALILYNSSRTVDNLVYDPRDRPAAAVIPIIYITREGRRKYLRDESASLDIRIRVAFAEKKRTGHNVVGYLDNGAANTVILGAHYDHLGYGEDSNSLYHGTERMVHTGADDNASGVAAVIELVRMVKEGKVRGNNYLIVAFSGKEQGLYGSKYFADHPTVDLSKVNYMIGLDMVGRLDNGTHVLTVGGFDTSPLWQPACNKVADKKLLVLKFDSAGPGSGDQTAFYRKHIPVLFLTTGINEDYHRPTDSPDKINFAGELEVVKFVYSVLQEMNARGRIPQ